MRIQLIFVATSVLAGAFFLSAIGPSSAQKAGPAPRSTVPAPAEDPDDEQDVKDLKLIDSWLDHINYRRVLPLVALDLDNNKLIGDATLHRGKHAAKHIGEIRVFVARTHRNLGLGSLMLEELINLAFKENLQWLKAEVIADHKKVIKAFRAHGFEQKALLETYGRTHPALVTAMRSAVTGSAGACSRLA